MGVNNLIEREMLKIFFLCHEFVACFRNTYERIISGVGQYLISYHPISSATLHPGSEICVGWHGLQFPTKLPQATEHDIPASDDDTN